MTGQSATRREFEPGGLNLLDASAFVAGAATAAVHFRIVANQVGSGAGWVLLGLTYTWAAVTASGPYVMLVRRFVRRVAGYPRVGDVSWALLGLPWVVAALLPGGVVDTGSVLDAAPIRLFYLGTIVIGVGAASTAAIALTWASWVAGPPRSAGESLPWTERVGLILAVAWPIQCGLGLEVIG